jgi:hypothetical protein
MSPGRIFCFFGFHSYVKRIWNTRGGIKIQYRVCPRCKHSPTWER